MEPNIKSSFIPTDTVRRRSGGGVGSYAGGAFDLVTLGAVILFVASLALASSFVSS